MFSFKINKLSTTDNIHDGKPCDVLYTGYLNEKIHLKNGSPLLVKRGCYTTKDIEKVSSGKVKYDSLTGKSVIDPTISRFGPYMNKILGISNGNYLDTLLSKKIFHLKLTNYRPLTTYSMATIEKNVFI